MPMRIDCKNYESRTYPSGDTVRKCNLDLAPEAPWRCPENCSAYAPRLADVNWKYGTMVAPPTPPEPPGLGESAADVLEAAENIVNAAGDDIAAEWQTKKGRRPFWQRKRRR